MKPKHTFNPDYTVPPGATLKETLEVMGLSQAELSVRTGLLEKTISQLVTGHAALTLEIADKLELALGIPARFWNRRELAYRKGISKEAAKEAANDGCSQKLF